MISFLFQRTFPVVRFLGRIVPAEGLGAGADLVLDLELALNVGNSAIRRGRRGRTASGRRRRTADRVTWQRLAAIVVHRAHRLGFVVGQLR